MSAGEPRAMTIGRHFGNTAAVLQGAIEIIAGAGTDIGGAAVCSTGIGCLVTPEAEMAGTSVAIHGGSIVISGIVSEKELIVSQYKGGRYKDLATGNGLERHHMPPDSTSSIPKKDGPAIQMDRPDHYQTSSWGTKGRAYRAQLKELIKTGRMRGAMARDIMDVKRLFGSKYNQAIQEMLEYARKLGILNK